MAKSGDQWFFDSKTGEVSQGKVCGFIDRLGPFATREEAGKALENARLRNKEWDEEDAADEA